MLRQGFFFQNDPVLEAFQGTAGQEGFRRLKKGPHWLASWFFNKKVIKRFVFNNLFQKCCLIVK